MKAFLKRWWWLIAAAVVAALVVWRLWPKVPGVKRKITFFDLPVISGSSSDAITSDDERTPANGTPSQLDEINRLAEQAIADYDNG